MDLDHMTVGSEAVEFVPGSDGVYSYPTGNSIFAGCIVELVPENEEVTLFGPLVTANLTGYTWPTDYWVIDCGNDTLANLYFYQADTPQPPTWIIDDMIADAYARTPVLAFNPNTSPNGDTNIAILVHIPTYLWIDNTAWTPVTATATIPGGFSVTTTATPTLTTWTGGETELQCTQADMIPYDPNRGEDNQPSNCYTTYRHSSATQTNTINLAVTWTVNYTCSTSTCGGPLPNLTTRSTREVTVGEIQAIATPNP